MLCMWDARGSNFFQNVFFFHICTVLDLCVLILNHNTSSYVCYTCVFCLQQFKHYCFTYLDIFLCLQSGLLKLHSWFAFEVAPLCVLICGSIARYVADSFFLLLWLHMFSERGCVITNMLLYGIASPSWWVDRGRTQVNNSFPAKIWLSILVCC